MRNRIELHDVSTWPRRWRRIFMVLFPITLPLYMIYITTMVLIFAMIAIIGYPIIAIIEMWMYNEGDE